jgi:hypothetical protein
MHASMPSDGWMEFDRQVLGGVPHAVDIAHHLSCTDLSFPRSEVAIGKGSVEEFDLPFYCVVHAAHRKGVLRRFLILLERLRDHATWETIRGSRSAQMVLLEQFLVQWRCDDGECFELLSAWLDTHGEEWNPELGPAFEPRINARRAA